MKQQITSLISILALALFSQAAWAEVFYSKEGALQKAFPGADEFDEANLFLSDEDVDWIQKEAKVKPASRVFRAYRAYKAKRLLGFAFIDTHRVRSMNETILLRISPRGEVEDILLLAFHEPAEYQPSVRWLSQFQGKHLSPKLRIRQEIDGISGATLTSNAVVASARKYLAITKKKLTKGPRFVLLKNEPDKLSVPPQEVN